MTNGNLSTEEMIRAGVSPTAARRFQPAIARHLPAFAINTTERVSAWIGQVMIESAGFTLLEEDLFYTTPRRLMQVWPSRFANEGAAAPYVRAPQRLANHVYAGRLGNGPAVSGDGWRYRGRGLKQLTGRDNYRRAAQALGQPYLEQPERVAAPDDAVRTACWFWQVNGCNDLADSWQIAAITRRVNGPAMLQAAERRAASDRALRALEA